MIQWVSEDLFLEFTVTLHAFLWSIDINILFYLRPLPMVSNNAPCNFSKSTSTIYIEYLILKSFDKFMHIWNLGIMIQPRWCMQSQLTAGWKPKSANTHKKLINKNSTLSGNTHGNREWISYSLESQSRSCTDRGSRGSVGLFLIAFFLCFGENSWSQIFSRTQ